MKTNDRGPVFVIQRQSFSRDVGWFVQSEIEVTRKEFAALRSTIPAGSSGNCALHQGAEKTSGSTSQLEDAEFPLDILKFPTTVAF